jgi:acetamidase/formamidase
VAVIESTSDAQGDHPVTYLGQFGVKPQQVLRKRKASAGPRAETDTRYIMMGIDLDLDRAMRLAVQEVVNFLVAEKGLEPGYAYSLSSIAVDFAVGEAVDQTQIVTGKIPKSIFKPARGNRDRD